MRTETAPRDAPGGERLLPLPEARRHVLTAVPSLPVECVPVASALGSVLAEAVRSPRHVPPFANSSMDGYAVRASDTATAPVRLRVVGEILAGHAPDLAIGPGEAARIMTGAPLPDGADAVVMVEQTRRHGSDAVTIESGVDEGTSVRRPGEDIAAGQLVFEPGTELEPVQIGVLASLGLGQVVVHRRPLVGVLSTGDELATGTPEPAGAQIRDANRPMLLGLLERSHFATLDLGVAADSEEEISRALSDAATHCDAIVTTGGVSMGDVDYVRVVLEKLTAGQARWMKVAIKPAKPFAFGLLAESGVPVFGLAGNPVSAIVGFELFTRPALRAMAGHRRPDRPVIGAIATEGIERTADGKLHLVRVTVSAAADGTLHAVPSGGQGSHMLLAAARSNGFALVPDGDGVAPGGAVEVLLTGAASLGGGSAQLGDAGHPLVTSPWAPLVDSYGRVHNDLRISVTDRCNLRCVHCMADDMEFMPHADLLSFAEVERVAAVAHRLGVDAVRLTGGEPLVRKGIVELVASLGRIGFSDLSMTTNGILLPPLCSALKEAGLRRVNISCDSLRPDRFAKIRRRGNLPEVLAAMDAAEAAGLSPVRVNVVLMAGVNDDEVLDFAAFARRTGRTVRFIEFMPLDAGASWTRDQLVPGDVVLRTISERWPLEPDTPDGDPAPAERYRFSDGAGEIGVISSVTRPFCGSCNRLRLTADGAVRNCLFSNDESSVRTVLRGGGSDEDLADVIRSCLARKLPGHGINNPVFVRPRRSMSMIGGSAAGPEVGAGGSGGGGGSRELRAKVLTVSTSVHEGTRDDRSGEALAERLTTAGFAVVERRVAHDGVDTVSSAITEMAQGFSGLLVTTGGTGFSPSDLTPEATALVLEREAPGLAEASRAVSPLGALSRGRAGTIGSCLVLNAPGSPKGAIETLEAVLGVVPHALDLLGGHRPH